MRHVDRIGDLEPGRGLLARIRTGVNACRLPGEAVEDLGVRRFSAGMSLRVYLAGRPAPAKEGDEDTWQDSGKMGAAGPH